MVLASHHLLIGQKMYSGCGFNKTSQKIILQSLYKPARSIIVDGPSLLPSYQYIRSNPCILASMFEDKAQNVYYHTTNIPLPIGGHPKVTKDEEGRKIKKSKPITPSSKDFLALEKFCQLGRRINYSFNQRQ